MGGLGGKRQQAKDRGALCRTTSAFNRLAWIMIVLDIWRRGVGREEFVADSEVSDGVGGASDEVGLALLQLSCLGLACILQL